MTDADGQPAMDVPQQARLAHRRFPTGVTVVTTVSSGQPIGLSCNAFTSVSLDPPLVLICVNSSARSHEHLHRGEHIGINVLACDQAAVARRFASSGGDKFASVAWTPGAVTGVPVLPGACAVFETVIDQRISAGTHTIFVCEVLAASSSEREPLIYLNGSYRECPADQAHNHLASSGQD